MPFGRFGYSNDNWILPPCEIVCANVTFKGIDKEKNVTIFFCFSVYRLEILSKEYHDTAIHMYAAADVGG